MVPLGVQVFIFETESAGLTGELTQSLAGKVEKAKRRTKRKIAELKKEIFSAREAIGGARLRLGGVSPHPVSHKIFIGHSGNAFKKARP